MRIELSIRVERPIAEVFAWLRDIHEHPLPTDTRVLFLEKETPGPPHLGSRYRERVRILPWFVADITSEVTEFDPPRRLASRFSGPGIRGETCYTLGAVGAFTELHFEQRIEFFGPLLLVRPWLERMQRRRLTRRLGDVKREVERWELYLRSQESA
jgi:hypothetical protein